MVVAPQNIIQLEKGQSDPQNMAAAAMQYPPFKGWEVRGPDGSGVLEERPCQDLEAVSAMGPPLVLQTWPHVALTE